MREAVCKKGKCSLKHRKDEAHEKGTGDCQICNEQNGVVYHRAGIQGDYDDYTDVEELIAYIRTGKKKEIADAGGGEKKRVIEIK